MARLNITYNGLSSDFNLEADTEVPDTDVKRIGVELMRAGGTPLTEDAFQHFVVDRMGEAIYLRPKVPFG